MSEYNYLLDRAAAQRIAERVDATRRTPSLPRRRRAGRHALAGRLHNLADRIDG